MAMLSGHVARSSLCDREVAWARGRNCCTYAYSVPNSFLELEHPLRRC